MPLPVAHGLVGASVTLLARNDESLRRAWPRLLLGAALAIIPDFDLALTWIGNYRDGIHGTFTHSILFACGAGLLAAWLAREFHWRGRLSYIIATLSHPLLDFAVKKEYGGAQLLWPFSTHRFRLHLFSYFEFYPAPHQQPLDEILVRAFEIAAYEILIFAPVFVLALWWRQRPRSARHAA
jgi:membrane-bound metal-dependent hydrolase YbcI (DUF457 family)